jgi:hypothetical protein
VRDMKISEQHEPFLLIGALVLVLLFAVFAA